MSGLPWWLQAYILVAAVAFGLILGQPQTPSNKLNPVVNLIWSAILGAIWPATALMIAGSYAADAAKDGKK